MCIIVPLVELPDNKYTCVYHVQRNLDFSHFITSNLHLVLVILHMCDQNKTNSENLPENTVGGVKLCDHGGDRPPGLDRGGTSLVHYTVAPFKLQDQVLQQVMLCVAEL